MTELEVIKERALDDAAAQAFKRYGVKMEADNLDILCAVREPLRVEVVDGRIVVAAVDGRSAGAVMEGLKADPRFADRIGAAVQQPPESAPTPTKETAPAASDEERRLRRELQVVTDPVARRAMALRLRDIDAAKKGSDAAPVEIPPELKDADPAKRLAHYRAAKAAQKE